MYSDLVGKPWAIPCSPPVTYDCMELVREYLRRNGICIPEFVPLADRSREDLAGVLSQHWREYDGPIVPGVVVSYGDPASHLGVIVTHAKDVLHAAHENGARVDRWSVMQRAYNNVRFWECLP